MKTKIYSMLTIFSVFLSLASAQTSENLNDIPFKQWRCNDSVLIKYVTGGGIYAQLDGSAEEALSHNTWGANVDDDGNMYLYSSKACALRVIRKSDNRIFTITGNKSVTFGRSSVVTGMAANNGPASMLRFMGGDRDVVISPVGRPITGNGSIYVTDADAIFRIYINPDQDNEWWFEHISGPGTLDPATGVSLSSVKLIGASYRYVKSKGEFILKTAGQWYKQVWWIRDNKLVPVIPDSLLVGGANTILDGGENFVFVSGTSIFLLNSNTWKFVDTLYMPYTPDFGFSIDPTRSQYFYRGMDDYKINRILPGNSRSTLMNNGSWQVVAKNDPNGLSWATPSMMNNGSIMGTDIAGNLPVFVLTFLDSIGLQSLATTDMEASVIREYDTNISVCPNPFNPATTISYHIPHASNVRLSIYNVNGTLVRHLIDCRKTDGTHTVQWNGRDNVGNRVGSGIYFAVLTTGKLRINKSLTFIQ
jgi:hypothetical protein